jgi:hypothetical protein
MPLWVAIDSNTQRIAAFYAADLALGPHFYLLEASASVLVQWAW